MHDETLTIKSSILTERQKAVIETIRMRLSEQRSLKYLKEVGFPCSPATFYREKKKVEELKLKRLYHIASIGFVDQHLDRIDNTELFKVSVGELRRRARSLQKGTNSKRHYYGTTIFECIL